MGLIELLKFEFLLGKKHSFRERFIKIFIKNDM